MSNVTPIGVLDQSRSPIQPASAVGAHAYRSSIISTPRLMDLMVDPSPEHMAQQLAAFRVSVQDSLTVSSRAYRLLAELEKAELADCVPCTEKLRQSLASNAHYIVLKKLEEAETLLSSGQPAPK